MKILFTFLTEKKQPVLDQEEVCLLNFHQQIIMISSQNNVQKYRAKGHEQVFMNTPSKSRMLIHPAKVDS